MGRANVHDRPIYMLRPAFVDVMLSFAADYLSHTFEILKSDLRDEEVEYCWRTFFFSN